MGDRVYILALYASDLNWNERFMTHRFLMFFIRALIKRLLFLNKGWRKLGKNILIPIGLGLTICFLAFLVFQERSPVAAEKDIEFYLYQEWFVDEFLYQNFELLEIFEEKLLDAENPAIAMTIAYETYTEYKTIDEIAKTKTQYLEGDLIEIHENLLIYTENMKKCLVEISSIIGTLENTQKYYDTATDGYDAYIDSLVKYMDENKLEDNIPDHYFEIFYYYWGD